MTLRQLEYFVAVVEEGSFTRAAHRVHVAQPSLSQQIRQLEAELGGPLLDRLPHEIRLTAAGAAFLPDARAAIRAAARAERAARSSLVAGEGELEVATVGSLAVGVLPPAISALHQLYPALSIRLHEYSHRNFLEEAARNGVGDIAFGPRPHEWTGTLVSLGWEQFVVVLPVSHPKAGQRQVKLVDLVDDDWVLFQPEHGLSDVVVTACSSVGFRPRETVRTSQVEAVARLARSGLGVALIPENCIPHGFEGCVAQADPPVARELAVYSRAAWSPAARTLVEILARHHENKPRNAVLIP
jgi:DNA-binding transcriptional LysR family regulator